MHFQKPITAGVILMALLLWPIVAQDPAVRSQLQVSFPARDGWIIHADLYGSGHRGVVLVHGGRFTKDSWQKQAQELAKTGFRVLAIDMRGFGKSKDGPAHLNPGFGSPLDVLAALHYMRGPGGAQVSIVGASMGADAAAEASIEAAPGDIDRLILLGGSGSEPPDKLSGRKLFVVARDDVNAAGLRLPKTQAQFDRAQAQLDRLIIVTKDAVFRRYGVRVVW